MDPTFYCVVEGITDFKIIKKIIQRYYNNPNLKVECLQPALDATDLRQNKFGGWGNALNYLNSEDFKIACDFADYIIIQMDSDISNDLGIKELKINSEEEVIAYIELIKEKIIKRIDLVMYKSVKSKLIFAIAINSIECWLLPLLYTDARKNKTINCLNSINQRLKKRGYTIDPKAKNKGNYYDLLINDISKKDILQCSKTQFSLKAFLDALPKPQ